MVLKPCSHFVLAVSAKCTEHQSFALFPLFHVNLISPSLLHVSGCPPANIIKNPRRVSESLKSLIATPDVLKKDNEVVHLKATIITKQRADIIFLTFCNTSLKKDIYSKGNRKKFVVIK